MERLKVCTVCGVERSLTEYHRQPKQPSGLTPRCKVCTSAYMREYRLRNLEREQARARQWALDHPDRIKELRRQRYDKDRANAAAKRWQQANPEKRKAAATRYAQSPRGKANKLKNRWKLDTEEAQEWAVILQADPCCYCGDVNAGQLDHITARSRGGSHEWANLTAACRRCNGRKQTFSLLIWLLRAKVSA